jgi:hypothetical protein
MILDHTSSYVGDAAGMTPNQERAIMTPMVRSGADTEAPHRVRFSRTCEVGKLGVGTRGSRRS